MKADKLVYIHRKATDGTIFYVGIGNKYRPKQKENRSQYWKSIVSKHDYTIHIIEEGLTWEEACESEIALIDLIGRRDLGFGTLVNLTDGGEGGNGHISTRRVGLIDLNTGMTFESLIHAEKHFKLNINTIGRCLSYERESGVFIKSGASGLRRLDDDGFIEYVDHFDERIGINPDETDYLSDLDDFDDIEYIEYTGHHNEVEGELIDLMNKTLGNLHWEDRQIFMSYHELGLSMAKLSKELSIAKTKIFLTVKRVRNKILEDLKEHKQLKNN